MPLKGIIVWNSHAFNLTNSPLWLDGFFNMHWANKAAYEAQGGIWVDQIFVQHVPPFEQREYCATFTVPPYSRITELSSHTHQRGKRFRMWLPPQEQCGGDLLTADPDCLPGNNEDLFYESLTYEDPLYIRYHGDPWDLGNGDNESRTIKYCALYDNGYNNPNEVKRQSTSPSLPPGLGGPGGPCSDVTVACMGGPNKGNRCHGNDFECPQSECDACPSTGGYTTDDEMFAVIGYYYVQTCGNGNLDTGASIEWPEECDDGNNDDGDGCSKFCEIED
jgi:cysteine-rich repeat protein